MAVRGTNYGIIGPVRALNFQNIPQDLHHNVNRKCISEFLSNLNFSFD